MSYLYYLKVLFDNFGDSVQKCKVWAYVMYCYLWVSQVALVVKNLPANAGDQRSTFDLWVRKISWEKGMATHSSILAWRISWTKETGRL